MTGLCGAGREPCGRPARLYPRGWRCDQHSPCAQAGIPEYPPGPGYTPQTLPTPQSASALMDTRAVASGKRRSTPAAYRAARQAVQRPTS